MVQWRRLVWCSHSCQDDLCTGWCSLECCWWLVHQFSRCRALTCTGRWLWTLWTFSTQQWSRSPSAYAASSDLSPSAWLRTPSALVQTWAGAAREHAAFPLPFRVFTYTLKTLQMKNMGQHLKSFQIGQKIKQDYIKQPTGFQSTNRFSEHQESIRNKSVKSQAQTKLEQTWASQKLMVPLRKSWLSMEPCIYHCLPISYIYMIYIYIHICIHLSYGFLSY